MEEKEALLFKEHELQSHRIKGYSYNEGDVSSSEGSEDWWEGSHSSCSSCCDSHARVSYEWEGEVNEEGQLFYIESEKISCHDDTSVDTSKIKVNVEGKGEFSRRGRLVNWMRRKESQKVQNKASERSDLDFQSKTSSASTSGTEVLDNGVVEIVLKVDGQSHLGSTLSEKLLGLSLTSPDKKNAIIEDIVPGGPAQNSQLLSVGDILVEINNCTVTLENVNTILQSLTFPCEVLLKVRRNEESYTNEKNFRYQSQLVKSLLKKDDHAEEIFLKHAVGAVVVDMEGQNLNKDDVIYCYPEKCVLSSCRGAFVTLFHLLAEITPNDVCQSSSVVMKKQPAHVLYKSERNFLLLVAIPQSKCSLEEATLMVDDLIRSLLFSYQSLKRCFETCQKRELDKLFSIFFSRILTNGFSPTILEEDETLKLRNDSPRLEDVFPYTTWVPLPRDVQVQIDDALNELEANDVGYEENDSTESQRLFNILGSCLFHKGYLLASHLPKEDLLDVHSYFRQNSLLELFRQESVKSLVIWREIFPQSVYRGLPPAKPSSYLTPIGRWFLLVVGQGFDSLAVILEAGSCCAKLGKHCDPVIAYFEEAEDTLKHIQKLGISNLASRWIESNARFKTITPEDVIARKSGRKKDNILGFVKNLDGSPKSQGTNVSPTSSKSSESPSPRKTKGTVQETSEDSVSQTASNLSEFSDENAPILGRRGERGRPQVSDSDTSDSDWDSSRDSNMRESLCSSGADNSCLGDVDHIIPAKLTTGIDFNLFHYVHIDGNDGVLMSPPVNPKRSTPKMKEILDNFKQCVHTIHSILENSIKFKKNGQEVSKIFINKSLVAVKEHGVLFECCVPEFDSHKKCSSFAYWIAGRLFFTPHPREVYVCYYDDAPQNLVEIAFRLALNAAG